MKREELTQWMDSIYMTLNKLDIKSTPNNVKNLSAIYYEFERVVKLLQQESGDIGDE